MSLLTIGHVARLEARPNLLGELKFSRDDIEMIRQGLEEVAYNHLKADDPIKARRAQNLSDYIDTVASLTYGGTGYDVCESDREEARQRASERIRAGKDKARKQRMEAYNKGLEAIK
jgi:hypothetical protein